ncbi:MAG: UDP-3-O-(3-hydroxymyristoyl)glucosamine N-acyltransferase [Bdellovibrionales bacterium]|nr:UDP-3-O-(3-hydroxymyristoyl)glucosamine N-acyltransferase [Bdellovibrionales bacterium]
MSKTVKLSEILKKYSDLVTHFSGPEDCEIIKPCAMEAPQTKSIVYISKNEFIKPCIENGVSVIVIPETLKEFIPENSPLTVLIAPNTHVAMALINSTFFPTTEAPTEFDSHSIHPTAVISVKANIANNVIIGPNVVIEEEVNIESGVKISANTTIRHHSHIGTNTIIGANTVIEPYVKIASDVILHSQVLIGHHCELGEKCIIQSQSTIGSEGYGYATDKQNKHYHKPHYGRVILHERVEIGAGVLVDRGAYLDSVIGEGTKVDNYCHLGHNLKIGKNCLITAGMITAGSVTIGDNCIFAGRVIVNGHISITDNVIVGPLAGISNSITKPGQYGGYPLQSYKESIKTTATLRHLTQLVKDVRKLKKHND